MREQIAVLVRPFSQVCHFDNASKCMGAGGSCLCLSLEQKDKSHFSHKVHQAYPRVRRLKAVLRFMVPQNFKIKQFKKNY